MEGVSRGRSWWSHPQGNLLVAESGGCLVQRDAVVKEIEGVSIGIRPQRVKKTSRKGRGFKKHESHLHSIP